MGKAIVVWGLAAMATAGWAGHASADVLSPTDTGRVVTVAVAAMKTLRPTAVSKLTEVTVLREKTTAEAKVTLAYKDGADDKNVAYVCGWKPDTKPPTLECTTKAKAEPKGDAPVAKVDGWDGRRREMSADDCGTSAVEAVATLKKWDEDAAAGLLRYGVERNRYSATVTFRYELGGREREKAYVCHWHGKEIDCH